MPSNDIWKKLTLLLVVTIPRVEFTSCVALRVLAARGYLLQEAPVDEATLRDYLEHRDPLIGWSPRTTSPDETYDENGVRRSIAFPERSATPCVAIYGDSFTFGAEGPPEHAFPDQLARRLDCPVNNYGVPGYGTDQALLRFRETPNTADVAILAHHAVDIVRNVNRLRNFLGGAIGLGFKPRFRLEGDDLVLVPLPVFETLEEVHALTHAPARLEHEFFFPGGPSGQVRPGFPHTLGLLRLPTNWRVRAQLRGLPPHGPFYDREHPSAALPLTTAILEHFAREAAARGQAPVVLLLPGDKDLAALLEDRPVPYQPLADALAAKGLAGPDVAAAMREALGERNACDLFVNCRGHYTAEGNRIVADALADWIGREVRPRS